MKSLSVIRDVIGLVGVSMIATGTGMIYLPAGIIMGGVLLVAGAILSARGS